MHIHHITIVVRDLESAVPAYERLLGQSAGSRELLPERGVIAVPFKLREAVLVLVQPTDADSVPGRHLSAHGEGLFLLSLGVDSLAAAADRLGEDSFSGPPRSGLGGWRIRDLDPAGTSGTRLQFTEAGPPGGGGSGEILRE